MYNLFEPVIDFMTDFWSVIPQPVYALFIVFLSLFAVSATFSILWRLH